MTPSDASTPLHLHIAGWSGTSHSIALVNQWQALALSRRPDVRLSKCDIATPARADEVFSLAERQRLNAIPALPDGSSGFTELRTPFVPDGQAASHPVLGFLVSEFHGRDYIEKLGPPEARRRYERLNYHVPSNWVRLGLIEAGAPPDRIFVIPHGVDTRVFRPTPATRDRLRRQLGLDRFTFMHVGGMVLAKGIDVLLRAFVAVRQRGLKAQLLLKGHDAVYDSRGGLGRFLNELPESARSLVNESTVYLGDSFDMPTMAALYGAADAYVAPYRAEGFCMPVLEAAASGLPLIATQGGATGDFTTNDFRWAVDSRPQETRPGSHGLEPDLDHLIELMSRMVTARDFHNRASKAGPRHVAANYTWDHVAGRIVEVVRNLS